MAEKPIEFSAGSYDIYKVDVSQVKFPSSATSLSLFPQWVWYTVAPAALWGGLTDEVLAAVQQVTNITYHQYVFDKPIFQGFTFGGRPHWNHSLWAVESEKWEALQDELLKVTLVDTESSTMVKYGLQELVIHDPLFADKKNIVSLKSPKATIYSFGVMSNKRTVAFNPAEGLKKLPSVFTMKPEPSIVSLADKALAEKRNAEAVAKKMREL